MSSAPVDYASRSPDEAAGSGGNGKGDDAEECVSARASFGMPDCCRRPVEVENGNSDGPVVVESGNLDYHLLTTSLENEHFDARIVAPGIALNSTSLLQNADESGENSGKTEDCSLGNGEEVKCSTGWIHVEDLNSFAPTPVENGNLDHLTTTAPESSEDQILIVSSSSPRQLSSISPDFPTLPLSSAGTEQNRDENAEESGFRSNSHRTADCLLKPEAIVSVRTVKCSTNRIPVEDWDSGAPMAVENGSLDHLTSTAPESSADQILTVSSSSLQERSSISLNSPTWPLNSAGAVQNKEENAEESGFMSNSHRIAEQEVTMNIGTVNCSTNRICVEDWDSSAQIALENGSLDLLTSTAPESGCLGDQTLGTSSSSPHKRFSISSDSSTLLPNSAGRGQNKKENSEEFSSRGNWHRIADCLMELEATASGGTVKCSTDLIHVDYCAPMTVETGSLNHLTSIPLESTADQILTASSSYLQKRSSNSPDPTASPQNSARGEQNKKENSEECGLTSNSQRIVEHSSEPAAVVDSRIKRRNADQVLMEIWDPMERKAFESGQYASQRVTRSGSFRRFPRFKESCPTLPAKAAQNGNSTSRPRKKPKVSSESSPKDKKRTADPECFFVGDPVPDDEARKKWPHHYAEKGKKSRSRSSTSKDDEDGYVSDVKCHYHQASIVGCIFNLGDCAYVKGVEGEPNYIGRILEFFKTMEDENYFTVQWFFRAEDTVLKEAADFHDNRRLFYSDLKNDNLLDCLISKVNILQVPSSADIKRRCISACDFYYDMKYSIDYSTFSTITTNYSEEMGDISSSNCSGTITISNTKSETFSRDFHKNAADLFEKSELALLDLYCGCGGMSTGLCLGAHAAGLNLVTKWAVDFNEAACKSFKLNHPEAQVRNESGLDFFDLLKEWERLCKRYLADDVGKTRRSYSRTSKQTKTDSNANSEVPNGEFEVSKLVDICYGDPTNTGKRGLKFKVRWLGYGPSEDTWEPSEGLSNCQDHIRDFVREGFNSKILPLPGEVGVVCGGPPCQGISGLNRHRNVNAPLEDEKNRQIIVFMDTVQFLKPKYVLMENVVDILKFANGTLGRYALSRLVHMKYQARLGIMAAGCYGLPQFRLRAFFLGTHPSKMLPQFPLPTHEVVIKGGAPSEFERNLVAYAENQPRKLEEALVLENALSDLPAITSEACDHMPYGKPPQTEFQRYIRSTKNEMISGGTCIKKSQNSVLYDHCSLQLSEENYLRICQIPHRKGACFRDLPGVIVQSDNSAQRDPNMEKVLLPSGKPLVPDYCFSFEEGKSLRPYGRLWWDDIVPTVLTTASPYFQATIHPEQDRVLTVREKARLQGFPDFYRFCGTIKERYCQIGNAVAIPVGRALGYALGMAWWKRQDKDEHLMILPPKFWCSHHQLQNQS